MTDAPNLIRPACMTPIEAIGAAPKRWWWILDRSKAGEAEPFVRLDGGRKPADHPLTCHLPDGTYLIGAGAPDCYREDIIVRDGAVGPVVTTEQRLPCARRGCRGAILCRANDLPESYDDDTQDPPRSRLCGACRA